MKNILFYLFLMLGMVLTSCASKKKVSTTIVDVKRDSISYVLPSENKLLVETLCDSLDRPLELTKTINTGVSETVVQVKDNKLIVEVRTDTIFKDRIQYRDRVETVEKEVVRNKTPFWMWIVIVVEALVILVLLRVIKI